MSTEQLAAWNAKEGRELERVSSLDIRAGSPNQSNETGLSPLPIEHCREYDGAAEHFARHCELPQCMGSPGALDWIKSDPEAFEQRVRETKYGLAMEATHAKHKSTPQIPDGNASTMAQPLDQDKELSCTESACQWFDELERRNPEGES